MRLRSPSLIALSSLLILSVTGMFLWRWQSLQEDVITDVRIRKGKDALFAARILKYSPVADYEDAIADSHRNTLVMIINEESKAIIATNKKTISNKVVPESVQSAIIKANGTIKDKLLNINGVTYHIVNTPINGKYRLYLTTNITKVVKDNWNSSFVELFIIWLLIASGLLGFCCIVITPVRRLKKATGAGQPVTIFWWWPNEIKALGETYNQLLNAQLEAERSLRHDTKTASGAVVTAISIIEEEELNGFSEYQKEMWQMLKECASLTCTLVNDIGRLWEPLKLEAQPLSELEKPLRALYATRNIQWGAFPDRITKYDKPAIISKVLCNLINNALNYAGDGASIWVGVKTSKDKTIVYVADNGVGLSPGEVEKVMTSYGASARLQPNIPGTGTGLFSARKALEGHGWQLKCKSKGKGEGSMFYFEV